MRTPFEPTLSHLPLLGAADRRDVAATGSKAASKALSFRATLRRSLTTVLTIGLVVFALHAVTGVGMTMATLVATAFAAFGTAAVLEINRRSHPSRIAGPFDALDVTLERRPAGDRRGTES